MMEIRVLEYFLAIVEYGSITSAAKHVHVAQPSLSRQLARLEQDLGLALFRRGEGALRLTPGGAAFHPVARDLVTRAHLARATARSMASGQGVPLTVVAPPTTIADVVAPFIVASGRDGPIVDVIEASPQMVFSVLADGTADFAVGTRPPDRELDHIVLGHAAVWAQVPAEHPWADRSTVTLEELTRTPLIVMDEAHGVRRIFDEAAAAAGLGYLTAYVARSPSVAQALAAAGRGVCVASDDPRFGLQPLPITHLGTPLHVTLFGAWDPSHYAAAQIRTCLEALTAFCDTQLTGLGHHVA